MSVISVPILLFIPIIAAIAMFLPLFKENSIYIRRFASIFSIAYFFYTVCFYIMYSPISEQIGCTSCIYAPVFKSSIPLLNNSLLNQIGIHFTFGVDAISVLMIILTSFIILLAILASRLYIHKHHKYFYSLVFLLESILIGIFTTTDMFVFFALWELELIPMYLLISIWGNTNAQKSALKFVLYTFGGSLFMLIGFLLIYYTNFALSGVLTADMTAINLNNSNIVLQLFISIFLLIGFGVKVPIVPLHQWLADTHTNSVTPVSMILAGILLKLGVYGLLRFNFGMLPLGFAYIAPVLAFLGLIGIILGGALAYSQNNIKRIIAYSSISQMGIIVLGIASMSNIGYLGGIFHMISHGLIAAGLFFVTGIIKNKFGTYNIKRLSGIAAVAPRLFGFSVFIGLAAMGVPFLSGFVGEFLSIYGAIISSLTLVKLFGILSVIVLLITAFYILRFLHEVFYGILPEKYKKVQDISVHEFFVLSFISVAILLLGCFPSVFINFLNIN